MKNRGQLQGQNRRLCEKQSCLCKRRILAQTVMFLVRSGTVQLICKLTGYICVCVCVAYACCTQLVVA